MEFNSVMTDRDAKIYELPCSACRQDFLGTRFQLKRYEEGKPVYCSHECASRRTSYKSANREPKPWKWLDVKHIVDELPKDFIEEPYVGY